MRVRLGTNPIAWSNDDLRTLGAGTSLDTCLAETAQAGFAGIELGHKFPRDAATLAPILARHNLSLVSGWHSTHLLEHDAQTELAEMQPHLDLLKALNCQVVIVAECTGAIHGDITAPLASRPTMAAAQWTEFAARLTALAQATAAQGLTLVYHYHMGTVVQSEADIDALMAHTGPEVHLLLDTGHAVFAGADPIRLARLYATRIAHIHTKDVRPAVRDACLAANQSFLNSVVAGVFTVPGDGCVDFAAVFAQVPNYEGWLVVEAEQDPEKATPLVYARLGRATLAKLAGAAAPVP